MTISCAALRVELPVPDGVGLAGFASQPDRKVWAGNVGDGLEANLLMIQGSRSSILLISIDCVYANEIARRLRNLVLSNAPIAVLASHTHYAPSLMPEYPGLGVVDQAVAAAWEELLVNAIAQLKVTPMHPVSFNRTSTKHVAARRRRRQWFIRRSWPYVRRGIVMAPSGEIETPACFDAFIGESIEAHLWSIAVHPTGYHDMNALTSEYPGRVRANLQTDSARKVHVLFGQGASGDIRQPFVSRDPSRVGVRRFMTEVVPGGFRPSFVRSTEMEWSEWAGELANKVNHLALRSRETAADATRNGDLCVGRATAPTSDFFEGPHPVGEVEVVALIVDGCGTLFVNAELTSGLAAELQSADVLGRHWLIIGCLNECVGYLATVDEMSEGGYECSEWPAPFGLDVAPRVAAPDLLVALCARAMAEAA